MEGTFSHPLPAAAVGIPSVVQQQQQQQCAAGFQGSMPIPDGICNILAGTHNPCAVAAGLQGLGGVPATLQPLQLAATCAAAAAEFAPPNFLKLLTDNDSPRTEQQQRQHIPLAADAVAAVIPAAAVALKILARTSTGGNSNNSSTSCMPDHEHPAAAAAADHADRTSDGAMSAEVAAPASVPASAAPRVSDSTNNAAAAAEEGAEAAAAVPPAGSPKGLLVNINCPPAAAPKMLQGTLLSPGANIEELEGCCQALMMLGALQNPDPEAASTAAVQNTRTHGGKGSRGGNGQQQQQPRGGRGTSGRNNHGRTAAQRQQKEHAYDKTAAGVAAAAAEGLALQPPADISASLNPSHESDLALAAAAAADGCQQQQLGRGKRHCKPQRWREQLMIIDHIVAQELGTKDSAVGECGGELLCEGAGDGGKFTRQGDGGLELQAEPPSPQPQQQRGQKRRSSFEDEGHDWAAEDDVSYDAAADAAAASGEEYDMEIDEADDDEFDVTYGGGRRSGRRGGGGPGSRARRQQALQRQHGSSRKSRRANKPLYDSEEAVVNSVSDITNANFLGVSKKRSGKWQSAVRFGHDGAYAFWCCYDCPRVAARARDAAALALRGPGSARLNFPESSYSADEIMAAAAAILAKHPQLALDHPLVIGMSADDVAAAAAAGGNAIPTDAAESSEEAAAAGAAAGGEKQQGGNTEAAAAADGADPVATAAAKPKRKRAKRGSAAAAAVKTEETPAAAATAEESLPAAAVPDTAAIFSRCFDLAALVMFGSAAITETAAGSISEAELAAAAAAITSRMPRSMEGRQQLLAALGGVDEGLGVTL